MNRLGNDRNFFSRRQDKKENFISLKEAYATAEPIKLMRAIQ